MSIMKAFDRLKYELQADGIKSPIKIFLESPAYEKLGFELSQIQRFPDQGGGMDFGIELLQQFQIKHISVYASMVNELLRREDKERSLKSGLITLIEKLEHT